MQSTPQHQLFAKQHPLQPGLSRVQLLIAAKSGQMKQLHKLFLAQTADTSRLAHESLFAVSEG